MNLQHFSDLIGINRNPAKWREISLSFIGGFIGIFGILMSSYWLIDPKFTVYIVPSMGASAVLLFAAPHAPFSQPWNLVAGHLLSAVVGVTCWQWIPNYTVAAATSVGLATGLMYLTRSIHPPGGATALAVVIGSESLQDLGFSYVFQPILINVVTILLIAIVFNSLFKWRRYPARLIKKDPAAEVAAEGYASITHGDFVYALSHIDTFIDIDEADLLKIYSLATKRHTEEEA
jgi:CBS domain-containing membrane protein